MQAPYIVLVLSLSLSLNKINIKKKQPHSHLLRRALEVIISSLFLSYPWLSISYLYSCLPCSLHSITSFLHIEEPIVEKRVIEERIVVCKSIRGKDFLVKGSELVVVKEEEAMEESISLNLVVQGRVEVDNEMKDMEVSKQSTGATSAREDNLTITKGMKRSQFQGTWA